MRLPLTVRVGARTLLNLLTILVIVSYCLCTSVALGENIPPKPTTYLFDPSHLVSESDANRINTQLSQYEKTTSNQILVAVFPDIPEGAALEDFTQRTAEAWQVGQKGRDNGVVLFIFVRPHKIRIEVGYGLEGTLPDITAHRIITEEIAPAFKTGDFSGGISRGINAIIAATRGEYRGNGRLASEQQTEAVSSSRSLALIFFGTILLIFFLMLLRNRKGYMYGPFGGASGMPFLGMPFFGGRRDDDDEGGGFGSGGGGFRGGGGGFGGGGASGGW